MVRHSSSLQQKLDPAPLPRTSFERSQDMPRCSRELYKINADDSAKYGTIRNLIWRTYHYMKIIDIHTHIIYDIDDGSRNFDMTLELIGMAYEQGVRGIFCTNHSEYMVNQYQDYYRRFEKVNSAVAEKYPEMSLYKGCEVECHQREMPQIISNIQNHIFPTMNGTEYVLMEFVPHGTNGMEEMRYCLKYALDKGYKPIIAHAERYQPVYDAPLENIIEMKELGCLVQINLYSVEQDHGSIDGGSRRILANLFLQHQLVDLAGTDTHNLYYKPPAADVGAEALRGKYGDEYADRVLFKNAEELLIYRI